MKVFLSHSTRDKDFVTKLAEAMQREGFIPWLCETSIDPASNWIEEINNGLQDAEIVLLIWSPDAANSLATRDEWSSAWAREITERRIRLGVVMLRDHPLPPLLSTKQYIDARRDAGSGIAAIMRWLKDRRDAGRSAGSKAPVYLPDFRPENFIARRDIANKLRTALVNESGLFLLSGEPGTGKSTLALTFAWESQKDFDTVVYQTCGDRPVEVIVGELADHLRQPLGEIEKLPPEQKLQAIRKWLRDRRSLLVLDDIWPPQPVFRAQDSKATALRTADLIPGTPASVLFTSRQQHLPWIGDRQREVVEAFTPAETEEVFLLYLGRKAACLHRDALLEFANRMGRLPIAVAVGADLLRKQFEPLGEAARELVLNDLRNEIHSVPDLFQKAIDSQGEQERCLLAACAICVQEGFWAPLAIDIAGLSKPDGRSARDHLGNSSLLQVVDRDQQRFKLHALLREQIIHKTPSLVTLREAHAAALENLFRGWEKRWKECRKCLEEIIPAAEFLLRSGECVRGSWLTYYGYACAQRIGEWSAALRILRQEEAFYDGRQDRDAKYALQRSYGNQAVILQVWGRLEEAMALHKKQEEICLELGNKNDLQASYGNQALILQAWGRLEEAMALHKKEEEICLELGNKNDLQIGYGNQALILQTWGRLEEAMALHKKEEEICLELGNKNDLQISYGNQAGILQAWGRLEEAMALHKKKEEICLELGNNYSLGYCYWNWGLLVRKQGDRETGNEKLRAALAIFTTLKTPSERDAVQAELG